MIEVADTKQMVITAAQKIYNELQDGYLESVYEEAMGVEFRKQGIKYDIEKTVDVLYEKQKVGVHRLDFIVNSCLVVELKAAVSISKGNRAQLKSYMRTLNMDEGIIINFPYPYREDGKIEIENT